MIGLGLFLIILPILSAQTIPPGTIETNVCPDDWSRSLAVSLCDDVFPYDYYNAPFDTFCPTGTIQRYVYGPTAELACDQLGITQCCESGQTMLPEYQDACDSGIDEDQDGLIDCADPACSLTEACNRPEIVSHPSPTFQYDQSQVVFRVTVSLPQTVSTTAVFPPVILVLGDSDVDARSCGTCSNLAMIPQEDQWSGGDVIEYQLAVNRAAFDARTIHYGYLIQLDTNEYADWLDSQSIGLAGCFEDGVWTEEGDEIECASSTGCATRR